MYRFSQVLLIAVFTSLFLLSPLGFAGTTDMVKLYGLTNGNVRTKYCEKRFKDKEMQKRCYEIWQAHIKKECGSSPFQNCFFDEDKIAYMKTGKKDWITAKSILDDKVK